MKLIKAIGEDINGAEIHVSDQANGSGHFLITVRVKRAAIVRIDPMSFMVTPHVPLTLVARTLKQATRTAHYLVLDAY